MRTPEGLLRPLWPLWLCTVTVWLIARNTVAKSPCKCGCVGGIYIYVCLNDLSYIFFIHHLIETISLASE